MCGTKPMKRPDQLPADQTPIPIGKIRKILVIKMRYIGDTVLVTPLLKAIHKGMPDAKIDLLVNRGTESVLEDIPWIEAIHTYDKGRKAQLKEMIGLCAKLRKRGYDLVVDLTVNDRSCFCTFVSRAPFRLGFYREGWKRRCYTHIVPSILDRVHTVDHHLRAAEMLDLPVDDIHPEIPVSGEKKAAAQKELQKAGIDPDAPFAIIHPGARRPYKSWPIGNFAELGDRIIKRYDLPILFLGGKEDRSAAGEIIGRMRHSEKATDCAGKLPLKMLPAVIKAARFLIGNDSAPIHIATGVRTPAIALFGPTLWEAWAPRRSRDRVLAAEFPCRPCGHSAPLCPKGEDYCMASISVDSVWDSVSEVMIS